MNTPYEDPYQAAGLQGPARYLAKRRPALRTICTGLLAVGMAVGASSPAAWASPAAYAREITSATVRTVEFAGHYSGHATLLIDNGVVTISSVTGKGTGTVVGASIITGMGSAAASAQCDPFSGAGAITGSKGRLLVKVSTTAASGCSSGQNGPVNVTFSGIAVVTGGTGTAKGLTGKLKFSGVLKLGGTSGSQNGPYTASLSGKLSA